MELIENKKYQDSLQNIINMNLPWDRFYGKTMMVSGATGLIGSLLIDLIMRLNQEKHLNCQVIALGRNQEKAEKRFKHWWKQNTFKYVVCDINQPLTELDDKVDYLFHFASNTHPVAYATDPIGTVTANILGTYQLLTYAAEHKTERVVFASSVEIYGENRGDVEQFTEDYLGYIDCNTLRAGYPESKRAGEALCQAFIRQKNLDIVIPRLSRTFGPTMLKSDTKALSQFLKNGLSGEDIVLKSKGTQFYSYSYVADAVTAILYCLVYGENGNAYNVADETCDIMLKDLAALIAELSGTVVKFELPDEVERAGFSKATKAVLNGQKLQKLGWKASYDMKKGLEETLQILKETEKK